MELWIDSADLKEIHEAASWGFVKGVTTNPTLALKAGVADYREHYFFIAKAMSPYPVSYQLTRLPPEHFLWEAEYEGRDMWEEGNRILVERHKIPNNVLIKVPVMDTNNWCRVIRNLRRQGIPVNTTLVFSPEQALLAAEAGANYVSVFVGRIEDFEKERMGLKREDPTPEEVTQTIRRLLREVETILEKNHYETKLLVASVRNKEHVLMAAALGAPVATVPFSVLESLSCDERGLSETGYERFRQDWLKLEEQRLRASASVESKSPTEDRGNKGQKAKTKKRK